MPSSPLILYRPLLLLLPIPPSIRVFSNESTLRIRWPKYWSFQLQHHSFQGNPRADFLQNGLVGSPCSPWDPQESSPTPQFKSINSSALSLLHSPTHPYMTTGKTIALSRRTLVGKVMSLLLNIKWGFHWYSILMMSWEIHTVNHQQTQNTSQLKQRYFFHLLQHC